MKKKYTIMKTLLRKAKALSLCSFAFMVTMSVNAQTWTGTTNSDFETATNWVGGVAPIAGGAVIIDPVTNSPIVASTTTTAFTSLAINVGGSINIQGSVTPSGACYTGGTIEINGGTLNVRSNLNLGVTNNPSVVNLNSGTLNARAALIVSEKGNCVLNINGGVAGVDQGSSGGAVIIGGYYAEGIVNLNGGTLKTRAALVGTAALAIDERPDRPTGTGHMVINGGTLEMGGDQTAFINGYVTANKIRPGAGKQIVATYDAVLNVTKVTAVGPKKVLFICNSAFAPGADASAADQDVFIKHLQADPAHFTVTTKLTTDGASIITEYGSIADVYAAFDLVVTQESFSSGNAIWKPAGLLGIKNITIPVIYTKAYAMRNGLALTDVKGTPVDNEVAAAVLGSKLGITVPPANQTNPLFTGIDFSGGNEVAIFKQLATDPGLATGGTKAVDITYNDNITDVATGDLANQKLTLLASVDPTATPAGGALPAVINPNSSMCVNDIPGGTYFGTAGDMLPLTSRMIFFAYNYGATALGYGATVPVSNVTDAGLKIFKNAALILTGQSLGSSLAVKGNTLESINVSVSPNPTSGIVTVTSASAVEGITVYDSTGRQVASASNTNSVDLSSQTSGLYLVKIQTENGSATKKVIVK